MGTAPKTTFTLAEAAALLSCHPETLRRAVRDGELRAAGDDVAAFFVQYRLYIHAYLPCAS